MVFILVKRKLAGSYTQWYSIRNKNLLNNIEYNEIGCSDVKLETYGGGHDYLVDSDIVLEILESKDWDVLDLLRNRSKTSEYKELKANSTKKELKIGWLSPSGKMHYCEYHDHIAYVHVVLGKTVPELEEKGWIHVRKDSDGKPYFDVEKRITQEQAQTLREIGARVWDEQIIYQ